MLARTVFLHLEKIFLRVTPNLCYCFFFVVVVVVWGGVGKRSGTVNEERGGVLLSAVSILGKKAVYARGTPVKNENAAVVRASFSSQH